ncbi:keratinocyte-associated protein 3-like [Salarias fasciatus]|uniref:Keratinocyte-associated protein 3-like n=1 Tax=Salarias fasciatus TaxID=181472 RepID=A0A672HGE9_SALFA|nr:keratinocyte-associated protein 3-like [Salarias fasciatus]
MAGSGVCCASLEEPKALMKMGLSVLLVGHVNFLLAALVHGVVLRHINLHKQARAMEYAISNVVALTSGLVGVIVGILTIILSKNRRRRSLTWAVFAISLLAALMAAASAVGLSVSIVRAIIHGGRSLLTHCRFPDAIGYSSVTNECPFDPTRIYSTTLILWVPLIVTCLIQLVYSARCFATCVSFLGLPCCITRSRSTDYGRPIHVVKQTTAAPPPRHARPPRGYDEAPPRHAEHHRRHNERPTRHSQPMISYNEPPRRLTAPPRQHRHPPPPQPQQHRPRQHHSLTPPERQPLRQPHGDRSSRERQETRTGSRQRAPEQHQLLQRGAMERSSFWI